jgi:biotin carboxylase
MPLSGKKLLILTAGMWQVPVITRARELGLTVIATDQNSAAPGLALADVPELVSCLDIEAVLAVARKHRVDGVVAEQTDIAVVTAAHVTQELDLPGIDVDTALRATNKWLMREACRRAGVPIPQYRKVNSADEARQAAEEIGLPVVVKPVDGQSSKGVAKVWKISDIPHWYEGARLASRCGDVLVEEMLTGTESSAEGFHFGERLLVLGISEKWKCPPPHSFDVRLIYPASFPEATMNEIRDVNRRVIEALGIRFGVTHAEYIVTAEGVFLLEAAARGCGAGVASQLIPAMTGFDPISARIRQALGEQIDRPARLDGKFGLLEFLMLPPGRIASIESVEKARRIPGVVALEYFVKPGDSIGAIENGAQRPGMLLAVAESRDGLMDLLKKVHSTVHVRMNPEER